MESKIFTSARALKKEMVNIAMSVMEGCYSDIVYDLEEVDCMAEKNWNSHFYWLVRKTGTHTCDTNEELNDLKATLGEEAKVIALVGRDVKKNIYEIVY